MLIDALASTLDTQMILLDHEVKSIEMINSRLHVQTSKQSFTADIVLNTLPPRLASALDYHPDLPQRDRATLASTPTWMGSSRKVVIEYEEAFWRDDHLSGFVFSYRTPLGEIHDACTQTKAALFGFVSTKYQDDTLEADVIRQLVTLFGPKAAHPVALYQANWSQELYTASSKDQSVVAAHPNYGYDLSHFGGKLHFIGTESSFSEGGYLEGALYSAQVCAQKL